MGNSMIMVNKKGINIRDLGMVKGKSTEYRNTITYPNLHTLTHLISIKISFPTTLFTSNYTFLFKYSSVNGSAPDADPDV